MRGIIEAIDGHPKIEIWKDWWMNDRLVDCGGKCLICNKDFEKVMDLVRHFASFHDRRDRRDKVERKNTKNIR